MSVNIVVETQMGALSRRIQDLESRLKAGEKMNRRTALLAALGITIGIPAACATTVNIVSLSRVINAFTESEPKLQNLSCNATNEICQELKLYSDAEKLLQEYNGRYELGYASTDIEAIVYRVEGMEISGILLFGNREDHLISNRILVDRQGTSYALIDEDATNYIGQIAKRLDLSFIYYNPIEIEINQ